MGRTEGGKSRELLCAPVWDVYVRRFLRLTRMGIEMTEAMTPRERLLTRFSARKLGVGTALAVESARKSDEFGDWHLLRDIVRMQQGVTRDTELRLQQEIEKLFGQDESPEQEPEQKEQP